MDFMFKRATKEEIKARVALIGPPGSGKTFTALKMGKVLAQGKRVRAIDTEKRSSNRYAGLFNFDVAYLNTYEPSMYIAAQRAAVADGECGCLIVDSASHCWEDEGGILDQVDARGGKFEAWKDMKPQMRDLVNSWLECPVHLIVTFRSKVEYVVEENEKGKKVPRKIGLAPRFKDTIEFELDIVGMLNEENTLSITKTRCHLLSKAVIKEPGEDFARTILDWTADGESAEVRIAALLSKAEGQADLDAAKAEIARAVRIKALDANAIERLKAAGITAAEKIRTALASGEDERGAKAAQEGAS